MNEFSAIDTQFLEQSGLQIQKRGGVVTLTLNRPTVANSLSGDLILSLRSQLESLEQDPTNRVVILTGAGERAFCGGADLKSSKTLKFENTTTGAPYADLLRSFRKLNLPIIARVNGSAAAGGVGLIGVCDFAVSVDRATFGISEIDIGFFPSLVIAALHRSVPRLRLNELCMLGEKISANDAKDFGLLSKVVPPEDLDTTVERLAHELAEKPTAAIRRGKYMLRTIESLGFNETLAFTETMLRLQASDPSVAEGLTAFRAKRAPVWS